MSFIERLAGFPAAGAAVWRPDETPVWRGGRQGPAALAAPAWWHAEACLALDFKAGRYMRGGAERTTDAAFTVTRSSHIRLFDKAGALQTIGNNTLPRTDRGLHANGQFVQSAVNWNAPADETISLGIGTFTLAVWGSGSVAVAAGTATGSGFGSASEGSPVTFTISGAGTVGLTVTGSPEYVSVTNTAFAPPAPNPPGTILASDVRAVQGVRPSDGEPEPFPGWEAAGLDGNFTLLVDADVRARGATARTLVQLNTVLNGHFVRFEMSAGGAFRARVAGADGSTPLEVPGDIANGRTRLALRLVGTAAARAQKGSSTVLTNSVSALTPMQRFFIGNNAGQVQPWNDWIYSAQICKPLPDAELLAWVNA